MSNNYYDDFLLKEERSQEPESTEVDKKLELSLIHI